MAIVDDCPAFSEGCPFSKIDADLLPMIVELFPRDIKEKCPAFKDGCPFKDTDSVETLYNKLSDMPNTHQPNKGNAAAKAVEETLKMVHTKSVEMKTKFNAPCPVFATSCPFKTVTTYGAPLLTELDGVVERWGLEQSAEIDKHDSKPSADTAEAVEAAEPLSKSLKAGTKLVHRSAENVHFVRDFLKGSVKKESYIELLRALYHVYSALEDGLRELPKALKHCDFSVLERTETLAADLRYYLDTPDGQAVDFGKPSPATQQYVDQVQLLAKEDPLLLLAHAYTRYLGDLSGGQILARAAEKAYKLPQDKGVSFYKFEDIGCAPSDLKSFKKAYRTSLDALQLSARRADAMVQEANKAFLLNILIFQERDVAAGSLERVLTLEEMSHLIESNTSALQFQRAYGAPSESAPVKTSNKCPFLPSSDGPAAGEARSCSKCPFLPSADADACPWPFLWTHDPKLALVSHPVKNGIALVGILGLLRVAWEYPKRSAAAFLASAFIVPWIKPKHRKPSKH